MSAMTSYGTWAVVIGGSVTSTGYVEDQLTGPGPYDVAAIDEEFCAAVNAALPPNVGFDGECFTGPACPADGEDTVDLAEVIESIDLEAIIDRHTT